MTIVHITTTTNIKRIRASILLNVLGVCSEAIPRIPPRTPRLKRIVTVTKIIVIIITFPPFPFRHNGDTSYVPYQRQK
jgi:hypothetical protein